MSEGEAGGKAGTDGELVPQPHGGAIYQGPPKNPVPGPGRPPSRVKEALRKDFDERRKLLADIADGTVKIRLLQECEHCGKAPSEPVTMEELEAAIPKISDRIRALEVMARFSDLDDASGPDRALIRELAEVVQRHVDDEDTLDQIEDGWIEVLSRRLS